MRKIFILFVFIIITLAAIQIVSLGKTYQSQQNVLTLANELWEMAIEAKGGRTLLYKIQSIAEIRDEYGKSVTFVALPDKYFSWSDFRPEKFGLNIKLFNFENGFGYKTFGEQSIKQYQDINTHSDFSLVKGRLTDFLYPQLFLLLETNWLQPKPIIALRDRVNGKSVDRVDVLIEGYGPLQRFAVYLDDKTHLPVRISMCRNINTQEISDFCCFANLRNYIEVNGIKIPSESSGINTPWVKKHTELNPEYDPVFFNHPPNHNLNGLQWRKANSAPASSLAVSSTMIFSPRQLTAFIQDLGSVDEEVQQAAVKELVSAGKQVIRALKEALNASDKNVIKRFGIAVVLTRLGELDEQTQMTLADSVMDERLSANKRQDAAFGLLGNDQGITKLIELLENENIYVRRYVLFAFDELTERKEIPRNIEKAIPILKKLQKDKDQIISGLAEEVLKQIDDHAKR